MSRKLRTWILSYLSLMFFGSFFAVAILWSLSDETLHHISQIKNFLYYFFAGAIGGSLYYLYHFCVNYMKNNLKDYKQWIMYVFYPLFATGTAVITITLIQSGILMIEFTKTGNPLYAQISIAFFVGFAFNRVIKKFEEVSEELFQSSGTKKADQNIESDNDK